MASQKDRSIPVRLASCVVVHSATDERRTLDVIRAYSREIELRWPMVGTVWFDLRDGTGMDRAVKSWRVAS